MKKHMTQQEIFNHYARQLGIKDSALGEWIFMNGRKVKIIGINPRARAMPVMTQEISGKRYKMRVSGMPSDLLV